MYSAQQIMSNYAMRKRYSCHVSHGENIPSENYQRTSLAQQTWNNFKDCFNMLSVHNQLSVTIVNDELLTSGLVKNSSTKTKDLSCYILQKEKFQHNLKQMYRKDYIETMLPSSTLSGVLETDCLLQDWDIIDISNSVEIRNDVNLIKNSGDTYEDTSTVESHFMPHINTEKPKKTMDDNMIDASGPSDIEPQKFQVDICKDADVESFLVVSLSDLPTIPIKENVMSYFSKCLKAFNSFASRIYCKTQLTRMSRNHLYLAKQQHRRKANAIAMGRGRGRAKCQLRRSGVSQTICRKECIKNEDNEVWQNNLLGTAPNDCPLNSKLDSSDNVDIPDLEMKKQLDSLPISSFPEATTKSGKPKARKKKKAKTKYVTKVRYITKSSRINNRDYCTDNKNEMPNAEHSSRSRTLSEYFADTEDDWIVFEDDNDDEELSERKKRAATEYLYVTSNDLMRKNDNSYDYSNSETRAKNISFRSRLSSESSIDSEDINYSSAISNQQETMKCPRIYDCLTKVSARFRQDFNNQMQKDSFRHCRILSDSSETSDGFNISDSDNSNSSFATEENDDFNSYDERSFHAENSQDDSIIFANEDSEELTAYISDNFHISDTDNSNSSFAIEGNDDVDGYDKINFHDKGSQDDSIIYADGDSETLTAQTKKVSFNPTPVVHVMVTWNYAYRAARKGPWEEIARDNERFKGRINSIAIVLNPILKSTHRSRVWQERFAFPE